MSRFADYIARPVSLADSGTTDRLQIRAPEEADIQRLSQIASERDGKDIERHRTRLARQLFDPEAIAITAELDGKVVAYAIAKQFRPEDVPDRPNNIVPAGWYLLGMIVAREFRRRGIGMQLTRVRLERIAPIASSAFYFANERNRVSIELHEKLGFREVTRDFFFPGVTFEGGDGVLFAVDLKR